MEDPIPQGEGAILRENVAAHHKVMGNSMASCANMAEPINVLFSTKTRVGPMYHVLNVGAESARGSSYGFGGFSSPLTMHCNAFTANGISR